MKGVTRRLQLLLLSRPHFNVTLPVVVNRLMRNWCNGNISAFQAGVAGSSPVFRSIKTRNCNLLLQKHLKAIGNFKSLLDLCLAYVKRA